MVRIALLIYLRNPGEKCVNRWTFLVADEAADINTMFHNSDTYKFYFNNGE